MNEDKIVIIMHKSGQPHMSFDILVHKDFKDKVDIPMGYELECKYVKEYIEENPECVYVTSEDNGHIPEFNWIDDYVQDVQRKGATIVLR